VNLPRSLSPTTSRARSLVLSLALVVGGTALTVAATTGVDPPRVSSRTLASGAAPIGDVAGHVTTLAPTTTVPRKKKHHVAAKKRHHARRRPAPTVPPTTAAAAPPPAPAPPPPPPPAPVAPPVTAAPAPVPVAPRVTGGGPSGLEAQFLSLLNQTRAGVGLPPLAWDGGLGSLARGWSATMSTSGLHHNPDLSGVLSSADPGWGAGGENVGFGPSVNALNVAFDHSPEHYSNIVKPGYTRVGVGVVVANGTIWVTFDFVQI